jgi:pyridinium-3,5-bisthiocarboxylic acid mononucleotide nickel chelatase
MKLLYIDPVSGISGDMTISALLDAGCPFHLVHDLLRQLPVELPSIEPEKRRKGAVEGTYLNIGESELSFSVRQMEEMIDGLSTDLRVKQDARGILEVIVEAESKVHGVERDHVHFHELSHIDTLIDVIGVARAISYFKAEKILCGPIPQGRGFIRTAHGIMPNPPPATTEIVKGMQVVFFDDDRELTTPTGAAILKYYVGGQAGLKFPLLVEHHGYGFGTRESDRPNVARVFIGEGKEVRADEEVLVIEADMDDIEIEYMGAIADRLRQEGALDVLYFPVQMKKGRSGIRLSITTPLSACGRLMDMVFRETTTFGLRFRSEFRAVLARDEEVLNTSFGPVKVKRGYDRSGRLMKTHLEYEEVKRIADEKGMPYRAVLEALKKEL